MLVPGLAKFAWLKKFVAVMRNRSLAFSINLKFRYKPKLTFARPGPTITPRALFPNRPIGGTAKSAGLNHRLIEWLSRPALLTRSGRPLVGRVLEGSEPLNIGVRYWPV